MSFIYQSLKASYNLEFISSADLLIFSDISDFVFSDSPLRLVLPWWSFVSIDWVRERIINDLKMHLNGVLEVLPSF